MNFNEDRPIFLQLAEIFIQELVSGEIKKSDKLPSVREIAKTYKVNPNTVTRSIDELVGTGLFEVKRGMGTYVIDDEAKIREKRRSYIKKRVENTLEEFQNLGIDKNEFVKLIMENDNGDNSDSR
ncbi:MAG: GntR family transcriptional regulator [Ezakiella sp.]|uniref:GntR family transcriptional regulator n=1 Tax=Ezakiella sp. TaxID=1935205 RepID=UPI00297822B5|nr:GntR family transcriptional regulator [Ezakiella sp.]MDD7731761.1 GntR family transcriptional regulator [Eubacteriales bacterium]MDY6079997.1 GntR family transcriptional regulator [Ezakiella sp.]